MIASACMVRCSRQVLAGVMRTLPVMPSIIRIGFVLAMSVYSTSCGRTIHVDNWESFSVVLERTACFGTCPVYTVTVRGSGLVEYVGSYNVEVIGSRSARIGSDEVRNLVQAFNSVNFLSLRDRYSEGCTDMPTAIISISFDGRTNQVSNYFGGCEGETSGPQVALNRLARQIDTTAGTVRWIKCGLGCATGSPN